jgi:hypothetical protein
LLLACRGEPAPPAPAPAPATDAATDAAAGRAAGDATPAFPRGDRHARAAARNRHVVKRVRGRLARADDRAVVIGDRGAPPLTLRIAPGTSVTLDGKAIRAEALPPGVDVRAAYRTGDGGRPTALTVEARRGAEEPRPEPGAEPPPASWGTPGPPGGAPSDGG